MKAGMAAVQFEPIATARKRPKKGKEKWPALDNVCFLSEFKLPKLFSRLLIGQAEQLCHSLSNELVE